MGGGIAELVARPTGEPKIEGSNHRANNEIITNLT
jgi:hypothetical protein